MNFRNFLCPVRARTREGGEGAGPKKAPGREQPRAQGEPGVRLRSDCRAHWFPRTQVFAALRAQASWLGQAASHAYKCRLAGTRKEYSCPCDLGNSAKGRAPAQSRVFKPIPPRGRLRAGAEDDQEVDLGF